MRFVSLLTAGLVLLSLYLFVMERDLVRELAGLNGAGSGESAEPAQEPEDTADAPDPAGADSGNAPVPVRAIRSEARTMARRVVLRGESRAERIVEVRSETQGRVITPPKAEGSTVSEGDVLCELDPGTYPAQLDEAKARLEAARASLPQAKAQRRQAEAALEEAGINQRTAEELSDDGFASETQLAQANAAEASARAQIETAKAAVEEARSAISSAKAAVAQAETQLDRLSIEAPFDGVVDMASAELGDLIQPGAACATLIQLDPMRLVGFASEADIDRIETGAEAEARFVSGRTATGTVNYVSRSADEQTRTFRVEVRVPNPDLAIRDGQAVEMSVNTGGARAHFLSSSALTLDDEGRSGVRVVTDETTARFVPVEVLRDTPDGIWVAGLADEAKVITIGQEYVTEGAAVAPSYAEATQ